MNDSLATLALLEATLNKVPSPSPGNDDASEASLLAQSHALMLLFRHLLKVALGDKQSGGGGEKALSLALRAQAQSCRTLQQAMRERRAAAKTTQAPAGSRKPRPVPKAGPPLSAPDLPEPDDSPVASPLETATLAAAAIQERETSLSPSNKDTPASPDLILEFPAGLPALHASQSSLSETPADDFPLAASFPALAHIFGRKT